MSEEKLTREELEEAKQVLEDTKKANEESKGLLARMEAIKAENLVSGRSEAGIEPKKRTQEEIEREGAMSLVRGTGLNPFD